MATKRGSNLLDIAKLERAIANLNVMLFGLPIIAIVGSSPFLIMVTEDGKRYFFVWFLVTSVGGYSAAILGSFIFARELLSPRQSTMRDVRRKGSEKKTIIHDI